MKEADPKTKREPNFELLRIVSMIMVVALHYWGKSGFLDRVPGKLFERIDRRGKNEV